MHSIISFIHVLIISRPLAAKRGARPVSHGLAHDIKPGLHSLLRQGMRLGLLWGLAAGTAMQAQAQAQHTTAMPPPVRQLAGVSEYRLPNGLQVLLAPNALHTRTYANLVVRVGSAHEGAGEGGMAHLLEHLVFKGSPSLRNPTAEFTARSLQWNGTTTVDRTNYFASFTPKTETLHWYLGWLADAFANSLIAKEDLDKEMSVVRNEFERAAGNTASQMHQSRMALTFTQHGYGKPTIGNRSDIENVPVDKLQAFYKTWYRPDNATLVVSGRFDAASALAHIGQVFGAVPLPATPLPRLYTREATQDGPRDATIERVGGEAQLSISWRGAPASHTDEAALDALSHVLVNSGGGRLAQAVQAQALGSGAYAWHWSMAQYGLLIAGLQLSKPDQQAAATTLLQSLLQEIAQNGIKPEELARAQASERAARALLLQDAERWGADLADNAAMGDWRVGLWQHQNMQALTIADVQRVAGAYPVPSNRVQVRYVPTPVPLRAPDAAPQALGEFVPKHLPQDDNSAANTGLKITPFDATAAAIDMRTVRSHINTGGGGRVKLALLSRPAAGQQFSATLRLHWGRLELLRGTGAEVHAGHILSLGTQRQTRQQIADQLRQLQSSLNISSSASGLLVNLQTTPEHWPALAELLRELLREPGLMQPTPLFEAEFTRWQAEQVAAFKARREHPESMAQLALSRALYPYPADHPSHTLTADDNIARWQGLRLADMQAFWGRFAGAGQGEFAAVGALDVAAVQSGMARVLQGWASPANVGYERIPEQRFAVPTQRIPIATPDKANANHLARRQLVVQPYSREAAAMQLATHIIGGGSLSSRLSQALREKAGLSYGVHSSFYSSADDPVAAFGVSGSFAPQNQAAFGGLLAQTLAEVRDKGFTEDELRVAKSRFADTAQQQRDSDNALAAQLARNEHRQRSLAFQAEQETLLQSLSLAEVNAAAQKLLADEGWVTVVTGAW
jgi:zinc protease